MADFSYDSLFRRAFGLDRGKPFAAPAEPKAASVPEYTYEGKTDTDEGTEFVSVRNALNARTAAGQVIFMPIAIGGLLLPNEPSISFSRHKHIVSTRMVGSRVEGDVKELISLGDWKITIRGVAVNEASTQFYPEDAVRELNQLAARPEALDVDCALTSLLGIYSLVITEISFVEMVGIQHAQGYELKCVSDRDFTLIIN
jgi:hypothetical protein